METNKFRLILLIYTVAITIVSLVLIALDVISPDNKIPLIRAAMLASYPPNLRLWDSEVPMVKSWVFMTNDADAEAAPARKFAAWRSDDSIFSSLCEFGCKLLVLWARNRTLESLLVAEDVVRRSLGTFRKFDFLPQIPWGRNWYAFSVSLSRLLVMYIYLGDKEDLKKGCEELMMRLVTRLNRSLSRERAGINVAYLGIPRLCTTYYFDRQIYDQETQEVENPFLNLRDLFQVEFNRSPAVFDGVYEDGSCIAHSDVATYSYFVTLNGFYESIYFALGLPSNIRTIAQKMLGKTLHPDIPWLPFGLFGRDNNRFRSRKWWGISGGLGIELMPFVGLAIFKAPGFLISLRIQRPKICTYETDHKTVGELALGWVQLRRIYVKGVDYAKNLTWEVLKAEPGMLIFKDGTFQRLVSKPGKTTKSFYCEKNSIDSFVGRLVGSELLFWKNQYNFQAAYAGDCFVTEAGVVASCGLEAFYRVRNETGKDLKFIWQDAVNKLAVNDVSGDFQGNSVEIRAGETKEFYWRMLVTEGASCDVRMEGNLMSFEFQGEKFKVKTLETNERFLVLKGDRPWLIGTDSSDPQDQTVFDKKIYHRDPETLMYVLDN